jgi:hypothetical protein
MKISKEAKIWSAAAALSILIPGLLFGLVPKLIAGGYIEAPNVQIREDLQVSYIHGEACTINAEPQVGEAELLARAAWCVQKMKEAGQGAPAEAPAEAPAKAPAEVPAETPAEAPAGAHAEAPAETPAEAPAEAPAEVP